MQLHKVLTTLRKSYFLVHSVLCNVLYLYSKIIIFGNVEYYIGI